MLISKSIKVLNFDNADLVCCDNVELLHFGNTDSFCFENATTI